MTEASFCTYETPHFVDTEDMIKSKFVHLKNSHQFAINPSDFYFVKSQDPANCNRFRLSNT
jgi:hypothetical protein